ncbi:hypothetical protein RRG08_039850 [Elysia crispata]|uniref:Uncharacterized protein n=1 Tax=Elysia crispata TaxID=231223 RepID=A0AAE0ZVP1_9GAST|nr:hypothetical protein RRG08_039850 [Elysia crispata]
MRGGNKPAKNEIKRGKIWKVSECGMVKPKCFSIPLVLSSSSSQTLRLSGAEVPHPSSTAETPRQQLVFLARSSSSGFCVERWVSEPLCDNKTQIKNGLPVGKRWSGALGLVCACDNHHDLLR